jgi:hypothetical protein
MTLPISNIGSGDQKPVKQGDSKDAAIDELDKDNSGASASAPLKQMAPIAMVGDAKSVKTQAQESEVIEGETLEEAFTRKHFVAMADMIKQISDHKSRHQVADSHIALFKKDNPRFDEGRFRKAAGCDKSMNEESMISADDLKADIGALFEGQELAEGFVERATSIFEGAVVARVNSEVVKAVAKLEEQSATELAAARAALAESVDQYMGYVVESWMKENQVAIDSGLRTEVAEGFIAGLKDLFVESYIEVPEDKVEVLEALTTDLDETKSRLNEEIEQTITLKNKIVALEKHAVLEAVSKDLASTDAERLVKLVEGVEYDSKELFAEKVDVIKAAHFKQPAKKSAETILAESTGDGNAANVVSPSVQRYVNALSRQSGF